MSVILALEPAHSAGYHGNEATRSNGGSGLDSAMGLRR